MNESAIAECLLLISLILVGAWLLEFSLRRTNPRWRILLWRVTCCSIAVSCALSMTGLRLRIPILPEPQRSMQIEDLGSPAQSAALPAPMSEDRTKRQLEALAEVGDIAPTSARTSNLVAEPRDRTSSIRVAEKDTSSRTAGAVVEQRRAIDTRARPTDSGVAFSW